MTGQFFNQPKFTRANDVLAYRHADRDVVADVWTKFHLGACVGLLGGFTVLLSAIFLTFFEYFSGEKTHSFWLFLSIYPMFAIGAHCLDKISELKNKGKNISYENDKQNF